MKTMQLKNVVWKEGKYFVAQCLKVEVSSLSLYFEGNNEPEIQLEMMSLK